MKTNGHAPNGNGGRKYRSEDETVPDFRTPDEQAAIARMLEKWYVREADGTIRQATSMNDLANEALEKNRHIRNTILKMGKRRLLISTIFLGLDHNLFPRENDMPVLWETMVFVLHAKPQLIAPGLSEHKSRLSGTLFQDRYSSEADAIEGHARAFQWAREFLAGKRTPYDSEY